MKTYYKVKTKAERQAWWNSLTHEEQGKYIESKRAEKAEKRQLCGEKTGVAYNSTVAGGQERRIEPKLLFEDYQHLQSITQRDYTKGIV